MTRSELLQELGMPLFSAGRSAGGFGPWSCCAAESPALPSFEKCDRGQELTALFLWCGECVEDVCMLQQELASALQAIVLVAVLWVFCLFANLTY